MTTTLQLIASSQASPEIPINENFETLSASGVLGKRQSTTAFLTWGYYGGRYAGNTIANGTVALTDAANNYVVVNRATGVVSVATGTTNWDDAAYARLYKLTTAAGSVTVAVDHRMDTNGLLLALPTAAGAVGAVAGSGGGDTRVIYVDGTTTAGDGTFTFNKTSKALTVQSLITPAIAAAAALALSAVGALTIAGASFAATATGAASITGGTTLGLTATAGAVTINGATIDMQVAGVSKWGVSAGGHITATTDNANDIGASGATRPRAIYAGTSITSGGTVTVGTNVVLVREADNTLAQRNGANAQIIRVYGDWSDASNYSKIELGSSTGINYLRSTTLGTGTVREMRIGTVHSAAVTIETTALRRWSFDASGHIKAFTDNAYDIGASGATRPRNVYVAGFVTVGSYTKVTAVAVASLVAAATAGNGARAVVNDANLAFTSANIAAAAVGGGANTTPVVVIAGAWVIG